ncbi:6-phospho-beta-glucosidase [Hydrogenispora ethanolica]|uniref:6-phospho-beta-glucosidase n=1 Tax=Hydrogenispora ethanolica TaxID=1082276 RepID=A0A4R1RU48_HYDET|nr:6-phospho-beta-glucosidase [Hydrogenispora ethanolica]TCL70085.1 6-phospho-beta-glucosidase [Hydrogenispora ethanolica]
MRQLKIAVIGAGSTYTPELINGFIVRRAELQAAAFYLMDIDREKLTIVAGLVQRMLAASNDGARVVLTASLDEAIADADYVIAQIRVGKLDARIRDEKLPLQFGLLGQETTGAGGMMKALRTIPAIMDIAARMKRLAPRAWLINFSNPSGLVAEAVLNTIGGKLIGLCNGPINMVREVQALLPEGTAHFDYDFVGLNHLCWITAVYADGRDVLQERLRSGLNVKGLQNIPQMKYDAALLQATGGIPISYLNYYYFRDEQVKKCQQAVKTRGEICQEIEAELLRKYQSPDLKECPPELAKRGGALYSEAAVSIINAIENDKNEVHVVDVRNQGAYAFMDPDDVVEVKCRINKDGATPVKLEGFDNPFIIGLMRTVKAYEKLAARAAVHGDYQAALAALLVHPLIGDYFKAKGVLDAMLEANREFLPQFFPERAE